MIAQFVKRGKDGVPELAEVCKQSLKYHEKLEQLPDTCIPLLSVAFTMWRGILASCMRVTWRE